MIHLRHEKEGIAAFLSSGGPFHIWLSTHSYMNDADEKHLWGACEVCLFRTSSHLGLKQGRKGSQNCRLNFESDIYVKGLCMGSAAVGFGKHLQTDRYIYERDVPKNHAGCKWDPTRTISNCC